MMSVRTSATKSLDDENTLINKLPNGLDIQDGIQRLHASPRIQPEPTSRKLKDVVVTRMIDKHNHIGWILLPCIVAKLSDHLLVLAFRPIVSNSESRPHLFVLIFLY
jgi:hypothetical protein